MKMFRRIGLSLVLAVALLIGLTVPLAAANPTVAITVTAEVISISNDKEDWAIGNVAVDAVVYFSTDGAQDDDWSTITNTGSVTVDVAIQGTDINGTGALDWALNTTAGVEAYSLYANLAATPTVYDVEVTVAGTYDVTAAAGLTKTSTNKWSMKFTAPSAFDALEDGAEKSATVTLVASKHV